MSGLWEGMHRPDLSGRCFKCGKLIDGPSLAGCEAAPYVPPELAAANAEIAALKAELAPFRDTTAERDQLRAALALGQINCDAEYDDLRAERDAALKEAAMLLAALKACDGKVICPLAREELDAALRDAGEES